jgi:hypothetical protein
VRKWYDAKMDKIQRARLGWIKLYEEVGDAGNENYY